MKRRKFLFLTGLGISTLPAPGTINIVANGATSSVADPGSLEKLLSKLFSNTQSAIVVGLKYLEISPDGSRLELLMHHAGLDFRSGLNNHPILLEKIIRKHQRDFENSNTVLVDNWVLSRTEASLCGIMAFLRYSCPSHDHDT